MQPTDNPVPKHVGIILDGNRRFAKQLMLKPYRGHEWGAQKIERLLDWCHELDIKQLTLYCFSLENFNRPKKEFDYLMQLCLKEFKRYREDSSFRGKLEKYKIRISFLGRIDKFPKDVQQEMQKLMDMTKDNDVYHVNFAMAYGGRAEVVDATRKIAEQIRQGVIDIDAINENVFAANLYMASDLDMVIRTGGEKRSSNFFPYQSAYSEWFYLEKLWPEFEKEDFVQCIEEYGQRQRRFGK